MTRTTFDSSEYRKAMKAFDGIHCLNCGGELPPLTSRKDRARVGSVLMKCCNKVCKAAFLERTLKNWAELRLKVIERDSYTCQDCGYMAPMKFRLEYVPKSAVKLSDLESGNVVAIKNAIGSEWHYKMGPHWQTYTNLEVHHKHLVSEGGPEYDINNCKTLCHDCHKKQHAKAANTARKHKTLEMFSDGKIGNKILS